ncbi:beta family protein [Microbacterium testaceum]|uniref:beta family protein n=1 Tax=Microbacterium testaceum TaxID=2033 RepID=UPI0022E22361|nr:beta family protein [Microbacterium testaceum]
MSGCRGPERRWHVVGCWCAGCLVRRARFTINISRILGPRPHLCVWSYQRGINGGATLTYFPILKARQGELKALEQWREYEHPWVFPIVEVIPWVRSEDSDESPQNEQETQEVTAAVGRLAKAWSGKHSTLYIDAAYAEPDLEGSGQLWRDVQPVLARVLRGLDERGVVAAPVVRAGADPEYVQQIPRILPRGAAIAAILRVTAEDLDDSIMPLRQVINRTASALQMPAKDIAVVLDLGEVKDDSAMLLAARLARFVLPQLAQDSWSELAVAAGAFPVNLADVQAHQVASLARWDLQLWRSLRTFELPNGRTLRFADYGVGHPVLPIGGAFAAPPQLRYTQEDSWLVGKGKRQERRGHQQFYDICAAILARLGPNATPPSASWGDEIIHLAAQSASSAMPSVGPGNASTWRAIATSHHLAYTADQLRAGDEL